MRRWWLMVALLLSVGFNLGLLAAVAGGWWAARGDGEAATVAGEAVAGEEGAGELEGQGDAPPAGAGEGDGALPAGSRELGWNGDEGIEVPPPPEEAPDAAPVPEDSAPGETGRPASAAGEEPEAGPPVPGPPFGRGPDGGGPDGPPLERMADHLGLEGEPRDRFLELQRRFVRNRVEIQRRGRVLTAQMHHELASPEPDPDRVEALIDRRAELWREHEILTARTILETRSILEPEQQRRYLQVLRHLMGGAGGPGGPGAGRPGTRPGARLRGEGRVRPAPPADRPPPG